MLSLYTTALTVVHGMARRLSLKQQKFVAAFLGEANGNATEAARQAGYAGNDVTLAAIGTENLRKPLIAAEIEAATKQIRDEGIAVKQQRVDALNDRWRRMKQVIDERAADPEMRTIPGGRTGLLVKTYKSVGVGKDAQLFEEYAVDTGLLREMREAEKQAAQEMGQWTDRLNVTGAITFADLHALAAPGAGADDPRPGE